MFVTLTLLSALSTIMKRYVLLPIVSLNVPKLHGLSGRLSASCEELGGVRGGVLGYQ